MRLNAAWLLGVLGPRARDALPALLKILREGDPQLRLKAVWAAGRIGAEAAVPELMRRLREKDLSLRMSAATALGDIGTPARACLKDLAAMLDD